MKKKIIGIGLLSLAIGFNACQKEELTNPNKVKHENDININNERRTGGIELIYGGTYNECGDGSAGCESPNALCGVIVSPSSVARSGGTTYYDYEFSGYTSMGDTINHDGDSLCLLFVGIWGWFTKCYSYNSVIAFGHRFPPARE
jgi:hypothetical protein